MAEAVGYLILYGLGELGVAAAAAEATAIAAGVGTTLFAGISVGAAAGTVAIVPAPQKSQENRNDRPQRLRRVSRAPCHRPRPLRA